MADKIINGSIEITGSATINNEPVATTANVGTKLYRHIITLTNMSNGQGTTDIEATISVIASSNEVADLATFNKIASNSISHENNNFVVFRYFKISSDSDTSLNNTYYGSLTHALASKYLAFYGFTPGSSTINQVALALFPTGTTTITDTITEL